MTPYVGLSPTIYGWKIIRSSLEEIMSLKKSGLGEMVFQVWLYRLRYRSDLVSARLSHQRSMDLTRTDLVPTRSWRAHDPFSSAHSIYHRNPPIAGANRIQSSFQRLSVTLIRFQHTWEGFDIHIATHDPNGNPEQDPPDSRNAARDSGLRSCDLPHCSILLS